MVIAAVIAYALAALLLGCSVLTSRTSARKLRNAAFSVGTDMAYALIIFLTPNIVTAICIEAKEGIIFQ